MYAAAEGHSNLGIPVEVGKEFVRADAAEGIAKPDLGDLTDREVAEAIRDGELPSPTVFGDYWLFDVRVTGTGPAYRDSLDEWALRDPKTWLTPEFVDRCNGLPVIDGHPDGAGLNSEEYRERAVGNVVLPYIKGDEVWGIAKIFDADMATLMQTTHRSTSPGVTPPKGSVATELNDGTKVLDEGLPLNLDHLAVCEAGVWDKDGPPTGIRLDARKDLTVADESEELKKEKARADAAEAELADMKRADDARKDAEEKARKDKEESDKEELEAAEKEKADKAKKDKARKDWETKKDSESEEEFEKRQDCRMDGESDEEFEDRKRDRKAKKDAAKQEAIDADRGTKEIKDSRTVTELQEIVERQGRQLAALSQPPSLEDADRVAKAWTRADALFQSLGEPTPQPMHGESPIRYRRRLANALRPFTDSWKSYVFHDSQQAQDFDAVENLIYGEAQAHAKKVIVDKPGFLREIKGKTALGRDQISFIGDHRTAWLPFMPPTQRYIKRVNREPHRAAASR
jgi:Uncharacterized protein conserved in bacteria (DUF2213)